MDDASRGPRRGTSGDPAAERRHRSPVRSELAQVHVAPCNDREAALNAGVRERLCVGGTQADLEPDDAGAAVDLGHRRAEHAALAGLAELDHPERPVGPLDGKLELDGSAVACGGERDG